MATSPLIFRCYFHAAAFESFLVESFHSCEQRVVDYAQRGCSYCRRGGRRRHCCCLLLAACCLLLAACCLLLVACCLLLLLLLLCVCVCLSLCLLFFFSLSFCLFSPFRFVLPLLLESTLRVCQNMPKLLSERNSPPGFLLYSICTRESPPKTISPQQTCLHQGK